MVCEGEKREGEGSERESVARRVGVRDSTCVEEGEGEKSETESDSVISVSVRRYEAEEESL